MKMALPITASLSLLWLCSGYCVAQTATPDTSVSISGRVTISGKGAVGITVAATLNTSPLGNRTVAKTKTDEEGNYRLTGLAPGRFTILPIAKEFVLGADGKHREPGSAVNAKAGESITKIDFTLVRGGVVTGRITDEEGQPVIGERVNIVPIDNFDAASQISIFGGRRNLTDDRGVYRVYGLGPGAYRVSVGQGTSGEGAATFVAIGGQYARTFYPGVTDEAKATIIEVNEGIEVTNIDIIPGKPPRGFSVSGRVVDAESGQPVASVLVGYSSFSEVNRGMGSMSFAGNQADGDGKFRLEGIRPGRYAAFSVGFGKENSSYSDPAPFDISDSDVTGIEIKVRLGATINGVAVIENNFDPAIAALLQGVVLSAYVFTRDAGVPSFSTGKINPDGSFKFAGLAPGKARIQAEGFPTLPNGLEFVRTELDGMDQQEGIEVAAGAHITGVRLVFVYGTGSIRGEVKIEGGALSEGTTFQLFVKEAAGDERRFSRLIEIDARGHFVGESIPPGTYDLFLSAITTSGRRVPTVDTIKRTITVANGIETQVVLVVNLATKQSSPE